MQKVIDSRHGWFLVSMTGLGRASACSNNVMIDVVIKSVNCRGLEIKWRLPDEFDWLESSLGSMISEFLQRGRVDFNLSLSSPFGEPSIITLDRIKATALIKDALELNDQFHEVLPISMGDILSAPGVLKEHKATFDAEQLKPLIIATAQEAFLDLKRSREREGQSLSGVLFSMYQRSSELINTIALSQHDDVDKRFIRFKARMEDLFKHYDVSEDRITQEFALLAERSDFTEEIDRLKAHAEYFDALCQVPEPKGRKLDFVCQEMLRESNTLMSKAFDAAVTQRAIELKAEIERIREHVQNFE